MLIDSLRARLADPDNRAPLDPPANGRVGATLVLLAPLPDGGLSLTLTRRQSNLSFHPGQISFPGGRVDEGESIVDAALREANEEIGLNRESVTVLGRLPAFYIPPSRFWMSTVVATWDTAHELERNDAEVAEIMAIDLRRLQDPMTWRAVPLTTAGMTWAWQLGPDRLLWGATAVVTAELLSTMDRDWSGGVSPADLGVEQHVRPWEQPEDSHLTPTAPRSRPRLSDVAEERILSDGSEGHAQGPGGLTDDVVWAVGHLVRRGAGPVLVLAGPGRTGLVAGMVADRLRAAAVATRLLAVPGDFAVVPDGPSGDRTAQTGRPDLLPDPAEGTELDGGRTAQAWGARAYESLFDDAGVIVDGLLGRGLDGDLRGPLGGIVQALSLTGAPLISIDLPSGLDPRRGLVGPVASADVTIAKAPLVPAHRAPGVAPFLGDLYLSRPDRPLVRAILVDRPEAWAE